MPKKIQKLERGSKALNSLKKEKKDKREKKQKKAKKLKKEKILENILPPIKLEEHIKLEDILELENEKQLKKEFKIKQEFQIKKENKTKKEFQIKKEIKKEKRKLLEKKKSHNILTNIGKDDYIEKKVSSSNLKRSKSYYTLKEDTIILKRLSEKGDKSNKTEIAKDLAKILNRTSESIRDRIKRYLVKLTDEEKELIFEESKINPEKFIYFLKNENGGNKIEKFSSTEPKLQNREFLRKPRKSQKKVILPGPKKVRKKENFDWLVKKLGNQDPFFSLDIGVQFIIALFDEFKALGIEKRLIYQFVCQSKLSVNLEELFEFFKIKDLDKKLFIKEEEKILDNN